MIATFFLLKQSQNVLELAYAGVLPATENTTFTVQARASHIQFDEPKLVLVVHKGVYRLLHVHHHSNAYYIAQLTGFLVDDSVDLDFYVRDSRSGHFLYVPLV